MSKNVQEKQIYDAPRGLGLQLVHKFHTLCRSKKDDFSPGLLQGLVVKKIHLKIEDNLPCVLLFYILD